MKNIKITSILLIALFTIIVGCDDILEVPDISNDTVTLIAPSEGTVVEGNTTRFTWQAIGDADEYLLQVATPDFSNPSQVVIDSTTTATSFSGELLPNTYEWRVRAINSGFETIFTSNNFTVMESEGFSGNTLILESPADNFSTSEIDITLSWEALDAAVEYRVQILDETDELLLDEVVTVTELDVTFTEGTFTWQVRGQITTESTLFSKRSITIDTTAPNIPELNSPINNEMIATGNIDFSWSRQDISGSEERDSIFIYSDNTLQNIVTKGVGTDKSFNTSLNAGTYFWAVQAFDIAGNESTLSNTGVFSAN